MSLSSTSTIKSQLSNALGTKAPEYYHVLQQYLSGSISRIEYDEVIKDILGKDNNTLSMYLLRVGKQITDSRALKSNCTTHSLYPYSTHMLTLPRRHRHQISPNSHHANVAVYYRTKESTI